MSGLVLRRLFQSLFATGLVLGATQCAPEFTFRDDADTGDADNPGAGGALGFAGSFGGKSSEKPDHCSNERQDVEHGELDVDCGGPDCEPCPIQCAQGTLECDGMLDVVCETNVLIDAQHCGSCGGRCELPGASSVSCSAGECQVGECSTPFANCNARSDDGCEVNLSADALNCGACGEVCPSLHSTPSCQNGKCRIESCESGWADCNMNPEDGCERPIGSDTLNCGACGKICPSSTTATAFCKDGVCGSTRCDPGRGDCDGDGVCEQDLESDELNCGSCGNPCVVANGEGKCVEGACIVERCDTGFDNCDSDRDDGGYANGCETNTFESQENCGECGKRCAIEHANADCSKGICRVSTCIPPFGDCDEDGTSCETDTSDDTANCGSCGNDCAKNFGPANATGVCEDSQCTFQDCLPGFSDCNQDRRTCEANPQTDRAHCGMCGRLCETGPGTSANTCVSAECRPTCAANYADCDDDRANGCETNTQSSAQNCGGCDIVCSTTGASSTRCARGACSPTCSAGRGNCDGDGQNGCETNLTNDSDNCGGCDIVCSTEGASSTRCAQSECSPTCSAGRGNCDDDGQNGCEANLTKDSDNCGGCDIVCSSAGTTSTSCKNSQCAPVCDDGHEDCDDDGQNGCETELGTTANCGTCGDNCASGELCLDGQCQKPPRIAILSNTSGGTSGGTLNLNLALNAGANRLLLVAVVGRGRADGTSMLAQATPDSVTFAGQAMPLHGQYGPTGNQSPTDGYAYVFYYTLKEAALAGLGTGTKPLAINGNVSPPAPQALAADAILFSGVNQSSPLLAPAGSLPGSGCAPSINVSLSKAGSVIHAIGAGHYSTVGTPTPISLTKTLDYSFEPSGGRAHMWVGAFHYGLNTDAELASGSYPMGFTANCNLWVLSTVVVNRFAQ